MPISRGAAALVCERPLGLGVPELIVDDARAAMPALARRFFRDPSREVEVIGITGTNGKTTTRISCARSSSPRASPARCSARSPGSSPASRPRPSARRPRRSTSFARCARWPTRGEKACAIEVSSHALELGRADEVAFAAAVFTNLTQDHLDFHETMEDYFAAKRLLFESNPGVAIVNVDDEYGRRLADGLRMRHLLRRGRERR